MLGRSLHETLRSRRASCEVSSASRPLPKTKLLFPWAAPITPKLVRKGTGPLQKPMLFPTLLIHASETWPCISWTNRCIMCNKKLALPLRLLRLLFRQCASVRSRLYISLSFLRHGPYFNEILNNRCACSYNRSQSQCRLYSNNIGLATGYGLAGVVWEGAKERFD